MSHTTVSHCDSLPCCCFPGSDPATVALLARANLPNRDGFWRPGMRVRGVVTIQSRQVPLAVRNEALQAFRDFTVVFAQVGNTYEVRMLERRSEEHTSELQSLMRRSYDVYCLKKNTKITIT